MRNLIYFISIIALGASACKEDETVVTLASVTTSPISNITPNSGTGGGNVISDGGDNVTSRGVCWSTNQNPATTNSKTTDGSGTGEFISSITNLNENTTYYVRAYAINSKGTSYGVQESFTSSPAPVNDIDGNVYNAIVIGTQIWMKENLKTTKLRDNSTIPIVTDNTAWNGLLTPGCCFYNNNEANYKNTYGILYNWHAVNTGKLCPTGWHVPTDAEWTTLTTYLGGESVAGRKLKESGTSHWLDQNPADANNETKFTALPGGSRSGGGAFLNITVVGRWWSSTESTSSKSWNRDMNSYLSSVARNNDDKEAGLSVRCLKD